MSNILDLTELAPKRQSIKIEIQRKGFFRTKTEMREITYNNCDLETIAIFMKEMGEYEKLQKEEVSDEEISRIISQSAYLLWDTFYQDPKNEWLRLDDIMSLTVKQIIAMLQHVLSTINDEIEDSSEDIKKK